MSGGWPTTLRMVDSRSIQRIHHDGWVGDNPRNDTRDRAIHWQFENTFVD